MDRDRFLHLTCEVYKNEIKQEDSLNQETLKDTILIKPVPHSDSLNAYNYLVYFGTNFDLVEGKTPSRLFFATNTLLLPTKPKKSVGLYLSLYGNRTMNSIDTSGITTRNLSIRTLANDSIMRVSEQSRLKRTTKSDNLGAFFAPVFNLKFLKSDEPFQFFYTPSLEFIWRRTNIVNDYESLAKADTILERGNVASYELQSKFSSVSVNEYVFNIGLLGFLICHENKDVSVRLQMNTGVAYTYSPLSYTKTGFNAIESTDGYTTSRNLFFSGRLWLTERYTGITMQAEITNSLSSQRPFYGVTLSKAINFQKLGSFLKPITSRLSAD